MVISTKKKIVVTSLLASMAIGMGVTINNSGFSFVSAEDAPCIHEGNHYTQLNATSTTAGVKEYWVCCKCHAHWIENPQTGSWTEAGQAELTSDMDEYDDRYIGNTTTVEQFLSDLGFTFSTDSDGGITINGFENIKKVPGAVLPEGVVGVSDKVFKGNSQAITWLVIPESVTSVGSSFSTGNKVTLYFVGNKPADAPNTNVYEIQNIGWHYEMVDGINTPKPGKAENYKA